MAKITKDELRTVHYLAQEFGIDRHSDVRLVRAFYCSVGRLALKSLRLQDSIDPNVADFGGEHFNISGLDMDGVVDQRIKSQQRARYYAVANGPLIRHIVDWLDVAVRENHRWLEKVDAFGRPRKLLKSGTIEALFDEAERQLARVQQRSIHATHALTSDDLRWVCDLDHGLRLVQLLSPAALDDEGRRMKHCIGLGAYDDSLTLPDIAFYSVRDGDEMPLGTLEVDGTIVRQFVGTGNGKPRRDVAMAVSTHMAKAGWQHWIEVYEEDVQDFNEYHSLCRLLAMPYHACAMTRFRTLSAERKEQEIARLRAAAGLGPTDQVPDPPTPVYAAMDESVIRFTEIIVDEHGEPQEIEITRDEYFGTPWPP